MIWLFLYDRVVALSKRVSKFHAYFIDRLRLFSMGKYSELALLKKVCWGNNLQLKFSSTMNEMILTSCTRSIMTYITLSSMPHFVDTIVTLMKDFFFQLNAQ